MQTIQTTFDEAKLTMMRTSMSVHNYLDLSAGYYNSPFGPDYPKIHECIRIAMIRAETVRTAVNTYDTLLAQHPDYLIPLTDETHRGVLGTLARVAHVSNLYNVTA